MSASPSARAAHRPRDVDRKVIAIATQALVRCARSAMTFRSTSAAARCAAPGARRRDIDEKKELVRHLPAACFAAPEYMHRNVLGLNQILSDQKPALARPRMSGAVRVRALKRTHRIGLAFVRSPWRARL